MYTTWLRRFAPNSQKRNRQAPPDLESINVFRGRKLSPQSRVIAHHQDVNNVKVEALKHTEERRPSL